MYMIKKVFTIIILLVILIASVLPNLYIHSCSQNLCNNTNKELSIDVLDFSFCCNDSSFADHIDSSKNLKRGCCHTIIISQPDTFVKQGIDHVLYNSDFLISYFIPVAFLFRFLNLELKEIQPYSNLRHSLPELSGRQLLSFICILRI